MKVFLATSFAAKDEFHRCRRRLLEQGHQVPDWTRHPPIRPYRENRALTISHASENLGDVIDADCFVLVADSRSRSALVEFGVALRAAAVSGRPRIYVVGDDDLSMYFHLPTIHRLPDFDAVLNVLGKQE